MGRSPQKLLSFLSRRLPSFVVTRRSSSTPQASTCVCGDPPSFFINDIPFCGWNCVPAKWLGGDDDE